MGICFQPPASTILMSANSSRRASPSLDPYRTNPKPKPNSERGDWNHQSRIWWSPSVNKTIHLKTPLCAACPSAGALKCIFAMLFRAPVLLKLLFRQQTLKCHAKMVSRWVATQVFNASERSWKRIDRITASASFGRRRGNGWDDWSRCQAPCRRSNGWS
jgi:hypothetical protein